MSRSRVLILAVAIVTMAGVLLARQEPQFRTGTHIVPIYATVLDRDGRLVTDLTRDEFEVYDNGRRQTLTTFANEDQPITVVMMLDRSGSVEDRYRLVEDAAAEFVRHLTEADKARIGSFSLRVQIDPPTFTSDKTALFDILKGGLLPIGPTPLWGAALQAMNALQGQQGRRVVLVFTDGHDAPLNDQPRVSFAEVRQRAETDEVMVYGIGLANECAPVSAHAIGWPLRLQGSGKQGRGGGRSRPPARIRLPPPPMPLPPSGRGMPPPRGPVMLPPRGINDDDGCRPDVPDPSLRALAEVGGGGYFELRRASDLSSTFARVADELHQQYLLAFVAGSHDGSPHLLEVRVHRFGATVRARRGYIAPK